MKMMMIKNKTLWMLGLSLALISCNEDNTLPEIEEVEVTQELTENIALDSGAADFSNYVAIGASFTAGFTDGGLFEAAQINSFPNILASKFALVGGGDFNQPLMEDNIGGLLYGGTQIQEPRFYFDGSGPVRLPATPTTETTTKLTGSYNNYGIPGAKSFHLVADGYGSVAGVPMGLSNPYFARFSSGETANVLTDALTQAPTFFTLSEIGGNDVLGYALAGGAGVDQTGNADATSYGSTDITDPTLFNIVLTNMVTALTANGAKGVVANVPYITSLANFTTVPYNPIPLDEATATALNAGYVEYNGGLQAAAAALAGTGLFTDEEVAARTISFEAGSNAVVIIDESLTDLGAINPAFSGLPKYRQATADDLLLLASSSILGEVNVENFTTLVTQGLDQETAGQLSLEGLTFPLTDQWVLTPEEQEAIKTATDAYNESIANIAASNDSVVMVDLNSVLTEASTSGLEFDNYTLNTSLVTGGLISLDGVHLTSRGYALMANKILEAIDEGFGSNFSEATNGLAKADDYPTNYSVDLR